MGENNPPVSPHVLRQMQRQISALERKVERLSGNKTGAVLPRLPYVDFSEGGVDDDSRVLEITNPKEGMIIDGLRAGGGDAHERADPMIFREKMWEPLGALAYASASISNPNQTIDGTDAASPFTGSVVRWENFETNAPGVFDKSENDADNYFRAIRCAKEGYYFQLVQLSVQNNSTPKFCYLAHHVQSFIEANGYNVGNELGPGLGTGGGNTGPDRSPGPSANKTTLSYWAFARRLSIFNPIRIDPYWLYTVAGGTGADWGLQNRCEMVVVRLGPAFSISKDTNDPALWPWETLPEDE